MEKILVVLDAGVVSESSVELACYLARMTNSRLTGIFLEDLENRPQEAFGAFKTVAEMQEGVPVRPDAAEKFASLAEENIRRFKAGCLAQGVHVHVHRDCGIPLAEAVAESRFADLLVVDAATSFSRRRGQVPGGFVKDLLLEAECPVIIAPYSFQTIDELYFAYNDTASSLYAIKQFTYLFPGWKNKKLTIVNAREKEEDEVIEDEHKMKEWLELHYPHVASEVLHGDSADELFGYMLNKKNALLVMGAYGRSALSRFLKPSHAQLIVKAVNLPLFITHH